MRRIPAALFLLAFSLPVQAQQSVLLNYRASPTAVTEVSPTNPLPVTGSFSASLGGFTPSAAGARMTPLSVTTSDSSGNLPTGAVVVVSNVGANPMYCNVNAVAATTSDQLITSIGGWFAFTIPATVTTLHCIATGGTTTANGVGGAGLPTGTGGGSSGGGSSIAPVSSTSLEANHIIKGSAGNLYSFQISADSTLSAGAWWVMVYNATTAPSDGSVTPAKCYAQVSGTTSASYAWPTPVNFSTGITIGVSTTGCFTKTASAHAFISGDAQ